MSERVEIIDLEFEDEEILDVWTIQVHGEQECSICLSTIERNSLPEFAKCTISCGHSFHWACINKWLEGKSILDLTCPIDRKRVNKISR